MNKKIKNLMRIACLLMLAGIANTAFAGGTYHAKATATISSGSGKVYVENKGNNSIISANQIIGSDITVSGSEKVPAPSRATGHVFFTVYANPDPGYAFKEWVSSGATIKGVKSGEDGNNQFTKTDNPLHIRLEGNTNQSKAPEAVMSAVFVPTALNVKSNDYSLGTASIDKVENAVGDNVTVKAVFNTPHATWQSSAIPHHSKSVRFDGWYADGQLVSTDETMTYTVVKENSTLEARYSREFVLKNDDSGQFRGYFRMSPAFCKPGQENENRFLCITGDFQPSISTSSGSYLPGVLQYNQVPEAFSKTYAATDSVFSNAGSVIYVTGTLEDANKDAIKSYTKVVTNVVGEAQGVTTTKILSGASKNAKPWLTTSNTPGFYMLYIIDGLTLQWTSNYNGGEQVYSSLDHLYESNLRDCGDFDVQPVDLAHIDTNYFGAYPSEEMAFEGGYWSSMYTSFPYECYKPDGVEAYIVTTAVDRDGSKYALLSRLEDGIVPAATPVLLKCKGLTPKENRLLPLLPDDSRLAAAKEAVEGNMLAGNYGLWTSATYTGRPKYDAGTMRAFSVNSEGNVGFYKLAANEDGSQQELIPNRAYLDTNKLPADMQAAPALRIAVDDNMSGIFNVDESYDAPLEYYTIDGVKVANPEHGHLYIVRKGTKARKVIY